jgi:tetratricopeptide (TPR) repeat protein
VFGTIQPVRLCIGMAILLVFIVQWQWADALSPDQKEDAYEYNRQGMIAMSQAEFEDAISEFQKAASLAEDYQILGRPLIYTPVFMTGWANEKIGRTTEACQAFRRYLQIALTAPAEKTKVAHARDYTVRHCQ